MEQLVAGDDPASDIVRQNAPWFPEMNLCGQGWINEVPNWWDKFCGELGHNCTVTTLDLSQTVPTQLQMHMLHGALKANSSVTTLKINYCRINDLGVSISSFFGRCYVAYS